MKTKNTALFTMILAAIINLNAQSIGTGLGYHSIVVKSDGTVYTWGYNEFGQLGNGNSLNSNVPVAVNTSGVLSGKTITQVAAGQYHSIALASDGTVYTWGYNVYGQLGNGNTGTNSNVPVAVNTSGVLSGKTITQVAAGRFHSIALASDGTVYTWGRNNAGQLGNGNNTDSNVPVAVNTSGVLNGKTITQVAAGYDHSIALASDGTVYTWGFNGYGQLGNGNTGTSNVPVAVDTSGVLSGKTITQVAAGQYHSIALASDGTVYTWGYNILGGLGNGNNTNSNVPVAVDQSFMGVLPVELTSFTAKLNNNINVLLNWQTATEVDNYGFQVERSIKNEKLKIKNWDVVSFVNGHGNSNSVKEYSFTDILDHDLALNLDQKIYYRLKQIDTDGAFEYSDVVEVFLNTLPTEFSLEQNYPNPFNPSTEIRYQISENRNVKLIVYDILGNEVATMVNEVKEAGNYSITFNSNDYNLSSGIYYYKINVVSLNGEQSFTSVKKMLLLK